MDHRLAQVNVARMRDALDSDPMQGFVAAVDPVNRLADESPGFVWRLAAGGGHVATVLPDTDSWLVVNVSVWRSYEALHAFVYCSGHGAFVRRRSRWFLPTPQPSTALWWVSATELPTVDDALRRLAVLRRYGASPRAFSLRHRYDPAGRPIQRVRATS